MIAVARQQFLDDPNPLIDTYTYDNNGNMTCRYESSQGWVHSYNPENRLSKVEKVTGDCTTHGSTTDTWTFTYDGDGVRVKEVYTNATDTITKYYFAGGAYEVVDDGTTTTTKKYYTLAGMMVAMHDGASLKYFAYCLPQACTPSSSTSIVMNASGGLISHNRYMPFGEVRDITGSNDPITQTDFGYTGQRNLGGMGLMDYKARFYSPLLGRFIQADTSVLDLGTPQNLNRYSYVNNNPKIYNDPSGHFINLATAAIGAGIGALVGGIGSAITQKITTGSVDMGEVAKAAGVGAVVGVVAGATFGVGLAAGSAIASAAGVTAGTTAATVSGAVTVAASSALAGQAGRATRNALTDRPVAEGLGKPKDMLVDAAIGFVTFGIITRFTTGRWFDYGSLLDLPYSINGRRRSLQDLMNESTQSQPNVYEYPGTIDDAIDAFDEMVVPGTEGLHPNQQIANQGGKYGDYWEGGNIGFRPESSSGPPTLDFHHVPGYSPKIEIKYMWY